MFLFRSGDFNLPAISLKSTSNNCLRRLSPRRTFTFNRLSGGSATTACDSAASLYTVPITGGSISTLMWRPSLQAESAEPAGTSTVVCNHLVLSGSTLFYPANYTPTGGTLRSGIFRLPIVGGASVDVLATGDTAPLAPSADITAINPGIINSVLTTTFSADPSAKLIADYSAMATINGSTQLIDFNSYPVYGYPSSIAVGSSACPNESGTTISSPFGRIVSTDGTVFANFLTGTAENYQGMESAMQFIDVGPWPHSGCDGIVFATDLGSLTGGTTFILPGEPLPNTPTPVSTMTMGSLAVSNGVIYLSASQNLGTTEGSDSGIFTVTRTPAILPLPDGIWPASRTPITTKVISSHDPIPGITLGVASCPGGVSQIPTIGTNFTVSGNYLVFTETQQLQNCATMATSYAGGTYAYNLTTNAVQLVAAYGATLVPGDPVPSNLFSPLAGSLSADGHYALVVSNTNTGTSTTTQTLYSTYLPQIVTVVSLTTPSSSSYGSSATLTAKVSPNTGAANMATGSIKFLDGSTVLGTQLIDSTGTASISTSGLSAGVHAFQALYAGDALYEGAGSATSNLTILKTTSTLTLHSSAATAGIGQAVTFMAQASGIAGYPTSQIVFSSGTTSLGTVALGATGAATLTLASLPVGTSQVIATYAGDVNFNGATTTAITISIGTPDYSIFASPASATITAGQSATFAFTITPVFGFSSPVTFSCGALPSEANCNFAPATVTPGSGAVTSTLTITTTAPTISRNVPPNGPPGFNRTGGGFAGVCFAVLLAYLPRRLRQKPRWIVIALVSVLSVGMLSGCGAIKNAINQNTNPGTAKGTSTVIVSASAGSGSGAGSHTAAITVVI